MVSMGRSAYFVNNIDTKNDRLRLVHATDIVFYWLPINEWLAAGSKIPVATLGLELDEGDGSYQFWSLLCPRTFTYVDQAKMLFIIGELRKVLQWYR